MKGHEMQILEGLNHEQRAAVMHRAGPAIVLAGPGAGKTRTLTARTAALLQEGVAPESILLLTFTRTSARQMIRRAQAMDPRAAFVTAGTFHSIASRVLTQNSHLLGMEKITILDEEDCLSIIRKVSEPVKKDEKNWPRVKTISKIISYAANCQISIEESIRLKNPDYLEYADGIEEISKAYMEEKIAASQIDYDDALLFWGALLQDPEIGPQLRSKWAYVQIDEGQDSNPLQSGIIDHIADENGNVMIVGDPAQSIFHFRGSSPRIMEEFRQAHPSTVVYPLSANYRSTPEIVAIANAIDKRIDTGFSRHMISASGRTGDMPRIVDVHDAAAEAVAIADAIIKSKDEGAEVSEHAVLVRSTAAARRIEAEFLTRRIPFMVRGGTRIDEAAHIRDLLSIARLTSNLLHEPAWTRMLTRFPKIGAKAATEIAKRTMLAANVEEAALILDEESERRRTQVAILGVAMTELNREGSPSEKLERAIVAMTPIWSEIWQEDWKQRSRDLDAVLLIADEHDRIEDFLTAITLDRSIDRDGSSAEDKPDEDPVTISTIHSAKGLEWPFVHIPSFVQGGMPSLFANGPEEVGEELRIFFVAVTRAEKSLTLYRPRFNGNGSLTSASEYEGLLAGKVEQHRHVQKAATTDLKINSTRTIDIRSRIIGGRK